MRAARFLLALLILGLLHDVYASSFEGCMPQECTSGYRGYWNCVGGYRPACSDSVLMRTKEYPAVRIYDEDMMVKYKLGADIREIQASICMPKSCYATSMGVSCSTECVIGGTTHLSGSGQNYEIKTPAELLLLLDGRKVDYCQICMPKPKKPTFKSTTRAEKIAKIKSVCPDLAAILETLDEARSGSQDSNKINFLSENSLFHPQPILLKPYSELAYTTILNILGRSPVKIAIHASFAALAKAIRLNNVQADPRLAAVVITKQSINIFDDFESYLSKSIGDYQSLSTSAGQLSHPLMYKLVTSSNALQNRISKIALNLRLFKFSTFPNSTLTNELVTARELVNRLDKQLREFQHTTNLAAFWASSDDVNNFFTSFGSKLHNLIAKTRKQALNVIELSRQTKPMRNPISNADCLPLQIIKQLGRYFVIDPTCGEQTLIMFENQPPMITSNASIINQLIGGLIDAEDLNLPLCMPSCVLEDGFGTKQWDCTPFVHGCTIDGMGRVCKIDDSFMKCQNNFDSWTELQKYLSSSHIKAKFCDGCFDTYDFLDDISIKSH